MSDFRKYIENDKEFKPHWVELWMQHHEAIMRQYKKTKHQKDLDIAIDCMRRSIVCREITLWKKYCE